MSYRFLLVCSCLCLFIATTSKAQDCTVAVDALKGKYEGECNKGKAEGLGKAAGEDSYEGEFKAGYPNGKGKYVWKNGNWFDGQWVKGIKEGRGTMIYKVNNDKDSVVEGFWKKDAFAGKYEKPYIIYARTVHITNIACKRLNNTRNWVDLFIDSETGNTRTSISSLQGAVTKPEITNIQLVTGTYFKRTENDSYSRKMGYTLEDVVFPFRAIFTIGNNDTVELELLEPGKWVIDIKTSY